MSLWQLLSADFFLLALVAGIALASVAGPLGSFIVWRRMSFFGDTLAHSALLGIAIGLMTNSNPQFSIIVSSLLFALLLTFLDQRPSLSTDTLLAILAHSSLAAGIVVLALSGAPQVNLEAYLFGELLTVNSTDVAWVIGVSASVALALAVFWDRLLALTIDAELAGIEGLPVKRLNLVLVVLIALTIAVSMKLVGVLLITALLIVPPATARRHSRSPEGMAVLASIIGMGSVLLGLLAAFFYDTPVGPTIVVVATLLFLVSWFAPTRSSLSGS